MNIKASLDAFQGSLFFGDTGPLIPLAPGPSAHLLDHTKVEDVLLPFFQQILHLGAGILTDIGNLR